MKIYSIKDTVIGTFGPIWFARNNGEAIRSFEQAIKNDPKTKSIAKDLQLNEIGTWNEETGEIIPNVSFIENGSIYVEGQ